MGGNATAGAAVAACKSAHASSPDYTESMLFGIS